MKLVPKIMGIDPGNMTGCCLFEDEEFSGGWEFSDIPSLAAKIRLEKPDYVIAERFIIVGAKAQGEIALKTLGAVELLQSDMGFKLVYQMPSILSMWLPKSKGVSRSPHVRSATSHVLCYLSKRAKGLG